MLSATIKEEIIKLPECIPATKLIHTLLMRIAHNTIPRYPKDELTILVVYVSRKAYEIIVELANDVPQAAGTDWSGFDNYTSLIFLIERFLLRFTHMNVDNKPRGHFPPQSTTPSGAVSFIAEWQRWRERERELFTDLMESNLLPEDVKKEVSNYFQGPPITDDAHPISQLCRFCMRRDTPEIELLNQVVGGELITSIQNVVSQIQEEVLQHPPNEHASNLVTRFFMLAYILFSHFEAPNTEKDWKDRLKDPKIWEGLLKLVEGVFGILGKSDRLPSEIKVFLIEFEESLDRCDASEEMLQLKELPAIVQRPFHGRTVELVKMVHYLARKEENNTGKNRQDLKALMHDSIKTIEKTSKEVTDVEAITTESRGYKENDSAFLKVLDRVEDIFRENLDSQWDERVMRYQDAVNVDVDHLDKMRVFMGYGNLA